MYEYRVKILRVVDGDTVDVDIDLGFGVWMHKERVRLYGIDTPESRTRDLEEKKYGKAAKAFLEAKLKEGTFDDWFNTQEFVELFTGSNFRTGVGNSILEEVATMADATDLTAGAATGRALGRTLGNYLSTWAVPFGQVIDAERAIGLRGTEYQDIASDPTLDFGTTFKKELVRPLKQRGIGVTAEEEAAAPKAEYPFYPEGRKRLRPETKFIGATITNRASEDGEYLMRYGFDWRDFGSRSKVPSIKRFETRQINNVMPVIVESAKELEEKFKDEYKTLIKRSLFGS